jgi:GrpB-like predicted nucleotidyltransferase (UPF0157 family)
MNEMIGLKRHTVRVVDHDPTWIGLATEVCDKVRDSVGNLIEEIEHVGSTSVPGLPAKPILDLAASVTTLAVMPELIEKLTQLGYIYLGDGAQSGGHLFVWHSEPEVRTMHLHVVTHDDLQWSNYIRFRDLLREDSDLRQRYADLKQELGERFACDRKSYTDSKKKFIQVALTQK